ncbi:hypothetical protein B0A52_04169 [Exophiala mesophila]|uniref:Uncharacterized protein n=1 Tax=Exophiala mesophila TaxID=212818 RepID=A0A438NAH0_EXOME|nr:hypothetical protein B0A52_04169 [Exophiala mesophila]
MALEFDRHCQLMLLLGMTATVLAICVDTLDKQYVVVDDDDEEDDDEDDDEDEDDLEDDLEDYDEDDLEDDDEDDDHYQTQEDARRKRRRTSDESQDLGRENLTKRIRLSQQSLRLLQTQQRPPAVDRTLRWVSGTRRSYEKP